MPQLLLTDVPADALGLVLCKLTLAHEIAAVAPTCKVVSVAVRNALKVRPFSGEIVALAGHTQFVWCAAAMTDGRIVTGSKDATVKIWHDGVCERTIQAHTEWVNAVVLLQGGARFISASDDQTAKLWTLDGALERTFQIGHIVNSAAALPDGVRFVVGLGTGGPNIGDVRLYHVDGTLVHTFTGHNDWAMAVAVTPDGQHIISGSEDRTVNVWSVASKNLVSTFTGHTEGVLAVTAMPDGQRILSSSYDKTVRLWRRYDEGALWGQFTWVIEGFSKLKQTKLYSPVFQSGEYNWRILLFPAGNKEAAQEQLSVYLDVADAPSLPEGWSRDTYFSLTVLNMDTTKNVVKDADHNFNVKNQDWGFRELMPLADLKDARTGFLNDDKLSILARVRVEPECLENTFQLHTVGVFALVALPDNQHALSGSSDTTVKLFNVNDGAVLRKFTHHAGSVLPTIISLALLPDGRRFVSGSYDGTARIVEHGLAPFSA